MVLGFIVFDDCGHLYPDFAGWVATWVKQGKVLYREEVITGLEQAPAAFIGLLRGEAFGKLVVHINDQQAGPTGLRSGVPKKKEIPAAHGVWRVVGGGDPFGKFMLRARQT